MDKIKKFFEKKKTEAKFKLAGEGHKLNEPTSAAGRSSSRSGSSSSCQQRSDSVANAAQQQAAAAAVARLDQKKKDLTPQQRSAALIRAQAFKELESEKNQTNEGMQKLVLDSKKEPVTLAPQLAVSGVFYKCPLIGPEILPKKEIEQLIKEFLYQQLDDAEAGLTACLVIHTVNKNPEKVQQCVETLFRYLDNIVQHPGEEKYHKIRIQNKVFQEKVAPMEGTEQFLAAAGFQLQLIPNAEQHTENYWIFSKDTPDSIEYLTSLRDGLISAEAIRPELDRGLQILLPSQASQRVELPADFFWITAEEVKREQQQRSEQAERNLMLRTRVMRQREAESQQRQFRYTLIRIKFPDGPILQGTFKVNETLQDVRLFVQEALEDPSCEFQLRFPSGMVQPESELDASTLLTLQLCPSAILHFTAPGESSTSGYLKDELMLLMQSL